jgi:hypothetical protein
VLFEVLVIQNDRRMPKKGKQYVREDHKKRYVSNHYIRIYAPRNKEGDSENRLRKEHFYHEREYYKCQKSNTKIANEMQRCIKTYYSVFI